MSRYSDSYRLRVFGSSVYDLDMGRNYPFRVYSATMIGPISSGLIFDSLKCERSQRIFVYRAYVDMVFNAARSLSAYTLLGTFEGKQISFCDMYVSSPAGVYTNYHYSRYVNMLFDPGEPMSVYYGGGLVSNEIVSINYVYALVDSE